ncbi:hypothetical protein EGR_07852 [Echinococcus granulosus]|uniref:Uncharacterized protein n=1 Tax=Echinococcus granulosus TaxID=6210 RepID=W6U9W2_ECHGR|nr:hypothetical protein EGR_07852 [Echinococcus granulosus]EUB57316.1 hypothetical protein EGR_07852 [Echinococcus granulosus]
MRCHDHLHHHERQSESQRVQRGSTEDSKYRYGGQIWLSLPSRLTNGPACLKAPKKRLSEVNSKFRLKEVNGAF